MCKCEKCKRPKPVSNLLLNLSTLDYGVVAAFCVLGLTIGMVYYAGYLEMASQSLWNGDGVPLNASVVIEEYPKRLHPLFMALGFFGLQPLGMLLYRICCCYCRDVVTILHTILTVSGFLLGCAGLTYNHPFLPPEKHFTSFHSRLGLLTVGAAVLQIIVGIVMYIVMKNMDPLSSALRRTMYTPYHNHAGVCIFLCSALCCLTGLDVSIFYSYPVESHLYYLTLSPRAKRVFHAHMENLFYVQLLFILLTIAIFYCLIKEDFRSRGRILMARDEEYR